MSFLTESELKSVLYEYQLQQITEEDSSISLMAINAAIEEVKSYLTPNAQNHWRDGRPRYDVAVIFSATGSNRNALILELCKTIALYYVSRLANVDIIQERVRERYDRAIEYLEKVAGVGKFANAPAITPDLPVVVPDPTDETYMGAWRFGSRPKFSHDIDL